MHANLLGYSCQLRATGGIHLKHQGIPYNFVGCLDEDFCCNKYNIFDRMYESLSCTFTEPSTHIYNYTLLWQVLSFVVTFTNLKKKKKKKKKKFFSKTFFKILI